MMNLGLRPLEYFHYTRKNFIIVVKCTETSVFKNGSCSVDQRNQHFIVVDTTAYGWIYPEPSK